MAYHVILTPCCAVPAGHTGAGIEVVIRSADWARGVWTYVIVEEVVDLFAGLVHHFFGSKWTMFRTACSCRKCDLGKGLMVCYNHSFYFMALLTGNVFFLLLVAGGRLLPSCETVQGHAFRPPAGGYLSGDRREGGLQKDAEG